MNALADPDTRTQNTLPNRYECRIPIRNIIPSNPSELENRHCLCGIGYSGKQSESVEIFGNKYDFGEARYSVKAYFSAVKNWVVDLSFEKEAINLYELRCAVQNIRASVEMVLLKLGVPEYGGHLCISVNTTSISSYDILSAVVEAATKAVLNAFE